jgi:hypothetical protein
VNNSTPRFVKLDEANNELPADASVWSHVRDNETGLLWAASPFASRMKWDAAKEACAALGTDWRLPTIQELLSLVDYTRSEPAIDTTFFRDVPKDDCWWFWSSTPDASAPADYAWVVYFSYGGFRLRLARPPRPRAAGPVGFRPSVIGLSAITFPHRNLLS